MNAGLALVFIGNVAFVTVVTETLLAARPSCSHIRGHWR